MNIKKGCACVCVILYTFERDDYFSIFFIVAHLRHLSMLGIGNNYIPVCVCVIIKDTPQTHIHIYTHTWRKVKQFVTEQGGHLSILLELKKNM